MQDKITREAKRLYLGAGNKGEAGSCHAVQQFLERWQRRNPPGPVFDRNSAPKQNTRHYRIRPECW